MSRAGLSARWVRGRWSQGLVGAATFLTVIPMPIQKTPAPLARCLPWFPLVGAALGLALGGLGLVLDRLLPPGPVAALLLGAYIIATGALHLDGLMDSADGVFGGRTPERRRAIMRDSRVGAFGVLAGVLSLLTQYACLTEVSGVERLRVLVATLAAGRWAMTLALGFFPSAQPDGVGAAMKSGVTVRLVIGATATASIVALATGGFGAIAMLIAAIVAIGGGRFLTRRVEGLTGDAYGAVDVIAETTCLLAALVAPHAGRS